MSFTPQVMAGTSADGDYVYYNASVVNNSVRTDQTTDDPELFFQDTRQNPLIKDTSKYVMSVDNFTLNGAQKNLPIFIPQIEVGTDVNKTIYTLTFGAYIATGSPPAPTSGTVITATIPITWVPENVIRTTADIPTTATPRQAESSYYYNYSYQHWCDLMNDALTAAWRDVVYKATQLSPAITLGTKCPFFEFNPETGLFSLCQDANTSWLPYGTAARASNQVYDGPGGVSDALAPYIPFGVSTDTGYTAGEFSFVGFNTNLEGLITNFDTTYFGFQNPRGLLDAAGFAYVDTTSGILAPSAVTWPAAGPVYYPENVINVIPDQLPGTLFDLQPPYTPTNTPTIPYIRERQDFISTGSLWSPVASIVLVTAQVPVRFEGNSAAVDLGNSNTGGATASTGASQKVLLEVPINALTADMWRGFIDYKPLVPLFSALDPVHDGLTNIDVRVCWRSRLTGSLIPMRMYNSSSFTLRLRFVKKS